MKRNRFPALALLASVWLALALNATAAPILNDPTGEPYAPDFSKPLGDEWKVIKGAWKSENGILHGTEVAADKHAAVLHHPGDVSTLIVNFEFRLGEARTFYFGFDGKGHVGRFVATKGNFGIYEDSPNPPGEKASSKPLAVSKQKLKGDEWYPVTLEIRGDEMVVQMAGETLKGKHPYLATPKARYWFAVSGDDAQIRNLKVWNAKAKAQ